LVRDARRWDAEGKKERARLGFEQAAALAEELASGYLEKRNGAGYRWYLEAMIYYRDAVKPSAVVRIYRRVRKEIEPEELGVKADLLMLSTLHLLRDRLEFADLSGLRLGQIDFHEANLNGVIFKGCELNGTNLEGASLRGANFAGARLNNVNLRRANLARSHWKGAVLHRTTMSGAVLENAMLIEANMEGVNLEHSTMERATVRHSNLRRAKLSGANMDGVQMEFTWLSMADLRRANLSHARLEEVDLTGAKLEGILFEGANLDKVKLDEFEQNKLIYAGARISGSVIRGFTRAALDETQPGRMIMELDVEGERVEGKRVDRHGIGSDVVNVKWEGRHGGIHRDPYDERESHRFGRKIFTRRKK
jgi:uncharacterized protein YjbI with pentapeptide repeats